MPDLLSWMDQQPSYPHSPGYQKTETSKDAAEAMKPHQTRLQQIVLDALADKGPMTSHEIALATGEEYASIQPRTAELKELGKIVETGERRKRPGKKIGSAVWRLS